MPVTKSHHPETHLIPLVLQTALGHRSEIQILGTDYLTEDGTCVRNYIHVCDLVEAHVSALSYLLSGGQSISLNLDTGTGHFVREVFEHCQQTCQCNIPHRDVEPGPGDPPELVASGDKARKILNWSPHYSLDEIISTACN